MRDTLGQLSGSDSSSSKEVGSAKSIRTEEVFHDRRLSSQSTSPCMRTPGCNDWAKEQICDNPIDGLIVHTAGFDKDAKVFRIMDVWESQDHAERFIEERIQPM